MRMIFLIPFSFMKKNVRQTISILLSIILSVGMIVAVSCMMYSAHVNKTESIREQKGDHHYFILGSSDTLKSISDDTDNSDFTLQNVKAMKIKDSVDITGDFNIVLAFADSECRKMMSHDIISGTYPVTTDEIALDRYTLHLLNAGEEIGSSVSLGDKTFILSGIVSEPPEKTGTTREAFVCEGYPDSYDLYNIYLKFDEDKDLYKQVVAFAEKCQIDTEALHSNGDLIDCVIDGNFQRFINIVRAVHEDEEANFITLLMRLRSEMHLTTGIVSFFLVLFSIFIIYSIFSVSISKRMKEYSILQTIGVSRSMICLMLMIELYSLLLIGFPVGCGLGILADKLFFRQGSDLFSGRASLIERTHSGAENLQYTVYDDSQYRFFVDGSALFGCALLIAVLIIGMCFIISARINKMTVKDMMNSDKIRKHKERIYSLKNKSLLNKLNDRFMFAVPSKFLMIIISMSLGCILIISINFIAVNTRINNMMIMHSQEGLSSDVKISVSKDEPLDIGITAEQAEMVGTSEGISSVSAFMYDLGEISVNKDLLKWKEFWPEIAGDETWKPSPETMKRFNGIAVEDTDCYRIKTNIYGYDDSSLDELKDYIIEGSIDAQSMKNENGIILRTLIDAQNNDDGLDIGVGDRIVLKTVRYNENNKELLRFDGADEKYEVKEYVVDAVVNASLINNTEYIGKEGLDIIMTNEQMKKNYGIDVYNVLAVYKNSESDKTVVSKLGDIFSGDDNIKIYDNSVAIEERNKEIKRAESLIYGIAVLLMIIAVFNIINTISHMLDSKRYSFAVLRAIGISENIFMKMLFVQAMKYTVSTVAVIIASELAIQRIVGNMLKHVYGYINQIQNVSLFVNIIVFAFIGIIFTLTVTVTGKQILDSDIIDELKTE